MVEVGDAATSATPEGKGRCVTEYGDHTPRPGQVKKLARILTNKQLSNKRIPSPDMIVSKISGERERVEDLIRAKLKQIMKSLDLDKATSKIIRTKLQEEITLNLNDYKPFIDEAMLLILGQMDAPTKIYDYLYLGSQWNACNLEELKEKGISNIMNVTQETNNFFPEKFEYYNLTISDDDSTDLIRHFDETYKYIKRAKDQNKTILVHCRMGISRSAAIVIAYVMKANNWSLEKALNFVKQKRGCVKPNETFLEQLELYQSILRARLHQEFFESITQ